MMTKIITDSEDQEIADDESRRQMSSTMVTSETVSDGRTSDRSHRVPMKETPECWDMTEEQEDNQRNEDLEDQTSIPVEVYAIVDSCDLNISLETLKELSPEQLKKLYIKGIQDSQLWGAYGKNYKHFIRKGQTECDRHALCLSPPRMMMFDHCTVYTTEFDQQLSGCILREEETGTIYKCPFCPKDTATYCITPNPTKEETSMHNEYFSAKKLGMHIYRYHYPMQNQVHCPFCDKTRTVGAMSTAVLFVKHLRDKHDDFDKQTDSKTTNEVIEEKQVYFRKVMTRGKAETLRRQNYIRILKIQAQPNKYYIPPLIPNNNFRNVSQDNHGVITIGPFRMNYNTFRDNPVNCFDFPEELVKLCRRTDNPKDVTVVPKVIQDLNDRRKIAKTTAINECIRTLKIEKDLLKDERGNFYGDRELPRDKYFKESNSRKRQVDANDSLDDKKERKTQRRNRRVEKRRPRATTITKQQEVENPNSRKATFKQPDISIRERPK